MTMSSGHMCVCRPRRGLLRASSWSVSARVLKSCCCPLRWCFSVGDDPHANARGLSHRRDSNRLALVRRCGAGCRRPAETDYAERGSALSQSTARAPGLALAPVRQRGDTDAACYACSDSCNSRADLWSKTWCDGMVACGDIVRHDLYDAALMAALIRLFFPSFDPAPTVENFGARLKQAQQPEDRAEREQWLEATFNQPAKHRPS